MGNAGRPYACRPQREDDVFLSRIHLVRVQTWREMRDVRRPNGLRRASMRRYLTVISCRVF